MSWDKGEVVTAEDAKRTFEEVTRALGYEKLQAVWSLNQDGEGRCPHLHIAYHAIDPQTRKAVPRVRDDYALVRAVMRKAEFEHGFASGEKREVVERAESLVIGARLLRDPKPLLESLTAHEAVFRAPDIRKAIVDAGVQDVEQRRELLEKVVKASRKVSADAWTTNAVWFAEDRVKRALAGLGRGFSGVAVHPPAEALDPQQQAAREYVLHAGSRRKLVTSVAGSGKSRLSSTIADDFRRAGYNARAVSVTHAACEVLTAETGIAARTVASELFRWSDPSKRLGRRDVLVIDEVSMLGTQQGAELLEGAHQAGAIVIGFGDHKQFGSVGYGNVLDEWRRLDQGVDMAKTRRQNLDPTDADPEWMRRATEAMRAGQVREALDAYRSRGRIHESATQVGAREKLVEAWERYERTGVEVAVSTYSNRERIALSLQIREAARSLGRLSGDDVRLEVSDGLIPFAVGDRVTIRSNIRELELHNGMAATVVGIDGTTLQVERKGRVVEVDTTASDEHRKIELGYVKTTMREQGATRVVELGMLTRADHAASFAVAISRHMHAFEGFFSRELLKSYERVVKLAQREVVKSSAHDVFAEHERTVSDAVKATKAAKASAEAERIAAERAARIAAQPEPVLSPKREWRDAWNEHARAQEAALEALRQRDLARSGGRRL